MRRWRLLAAIVTVVALTLLAGACGGDDEEEDSPTATPPASQTPYGGGGATPPRPSQLPPEFIECMADQGIDLESSADAMHSPEAQQALRACLGSLHSGGGVR
jgi:hypothetical protein